MLERKGILEIEMTAIVLGANDKILSVEMPYGYELTHANLKGSCLEDLVLQRDGSINIRYYRSNLGSSEDPEFIFIHKKQKMEIGIEYFSIDKMLTDGTETYIYFEELKH